MGPRAHAAGAVAIPEASVLRETAAGDAAIPRLELREWADRFGLVAGITLRPLDLNLWSDDRVGQVMGRWRAVRAAFASRFPSIALSHQVHGRDVRWHAAPPEGWLVLDGVDGHATAQPGVLLTVTVADCVPVYLAAPERGAIALLHAGWRGTAARIVERGVQLLRQHAAVAPRDLAMHCGVGICGSCYEVGSEVVSELRSGVEVRGAGALLPSGNGPARVDLRALLARQARELGVAQVSVSPWCTAHDRDQFFSHRASGGRDGRMIAYLGRAGPAS